MLTLLLPRTVQPVGGQIGTRTWRTPLLQALGYNNNAHYYDNACCKRAIILRHAAEINTRPTVEGWSRRPSSVDGILAI